MNGFDGDDDDDDRPFDEAIHTNTVPFRSDLSSQPTKLTTVPAHTNDKNKKNDHPIPTPNNHPTPSSSHFGEIDEATAHAELRAAITKDGLRLEISSGRLNALYEIGKPIGKGKFSTVYKAIRKADSCPVALKRIALFDIMDAKSREKCLKEIRLVQSLDHPNIIRYMDGFFEDKQLILIFEYAEAGDLKRQLRKAKEREARFDERVIWKYFAQVAHAVLHMHERRILHRDLKPANIFLTLSGSIKVGDLGLGRLLSEQTMEAHSKVGTPLYMSPEVLRGKGYEWSSDVWSLGCILYELAMLRNPFKEEGLNLYDLFQKITTGIYPPISSVYSPDLRDLVDSMLRQDPAERIDMVKVVAKADEMRILTEKARQQQQQQQQPQNGTNENTGTNPGNVVPSSLSSSLPPPIDTKSLAYNNHSNSNQTVLPTPIPEPVPGLPTTTKNSTLTHIPITNNYPSESKYEPDTTAPSIEHQRKPMNRITFTTTYVSSNPPHMPTKPNLSPIDITANTAIHPTHTPSTNNGSFFPSASVSQPMVSNIGRIPENSKPLPTAHRTNHSTGMQRLETMDNTNITTAITHPNTATLPPSLSPLEMVASTLYQPPPVNETIEFIELSPTEASSSLYDRLQLIFQLSSTLSDQGKLSSDSLWINDPVIQQNNLFHRYCFALPTVVSSSSNNNNNGYYLQFRLFLSLVRYLGLRCTRLVPGDRHTVADYTSRMEDLWTDHKTGTVPPLMISQNIVQLIHTYLPGASPYNFGTVSPSSLITGYGTHVMKILMCLADNALVAMEFRTFTHPCARLHSNDTNNDNEYEIIEEGIEEEEDNNNYNTAKDEADGKQTESIEEDEALIQGTTTTPFTVASNTAFDHRREALLTDQRSFPTSSSENKEENENETVRVFREPWSEPFASPEKLQAWLREYENLKTRLNVLDKQLTERVNNGSLFIGSVTDKQGTVGSTTTVVSNWRGHVQIMQNYVRVLQDGSLPSSSKNTPPLPLTRTLEILHSLTEDINESLIRINDAERRWNNGSSRNVSTVPGMESVPALTAQYATLHKQRHTLETEVTNMHQTILNHQQMYEILQNDTEAVVDALEEKTNELSSSSRVQAVRAALVNLQKENANMLIQLGILQHTLIHKQYTDDTEQKESVRKGKTNGTIEDDNEEEEDK